MKYLELITDAFRLRNVIDENEAASPEQAKGALRKLNQMAAVWKANGIDIQYVAADDLNATLTIPDWAEQGVTGQLAITLAAGGTITPELDKMARDGWAAIQNMTIGKALAVPVDSILPPDESQRQRGDFYNG